MDKRLLRSNGRVAHASLQGQVEADVFTEGETRHVRSSVADLLDAPKGNRTCQLLQGELFCVLDENEFTVFGFRKVDGYVGWLAKTQLDRNPWDTGGVGDKTPMKVVAARSHSYAEADFKTDARPRALSFGSIVLQRNYSDAEKEAEIRAKGWRGIWLQTNHIPECRFVPEKHLGPLDHVFEDPAQVAEMFLHTPYLWGGNSAFGIDCSGLVQIALHACGTPCPRDSDQQQVAFKSVSETDLQRGDLVFWKGHVGMCLDTKTLIHANAHHMAVAIEPLDQALERIARKEFGDVTKFARPG